MQYVNGLDVAQCIYNEAYSIYQNKTLQWEEIADIDDCKVYTVDNPLYEGGLIFKCVGIINFPPEIPWNILYKVENQMKWDQFCIKSKILETYDQLNFIDFVAYASPIGGVPRYFSLFRTCKIDYQNGLHSVLIRSIDHTEAEKEIGNLDGVQAFVELKPSGWFIKEISEGVSQVTFITNLPASSMDPYLPNMDRDDFREMYRKSGIHCIYKIPNLKSYINQQQLLSNSQLVKSTSSLTFRSLEIFREVCDIIGGFDSDKWSFFRKINTLECYYKEFSEKHYRILYSDSYQIASTLEIIESFLFSKNSHLVDSWTYGVEVVETINSESQIYRIKFRSILDPSMEIEHYVLKQINHFPTGVLFIGFKSVDYNGQTKANSAFWHCPSGFIISPLGSGQFLMRFIIQFDSNLENYLQNDILTYSSKRKILVSFSEKTSYFSQSLKSIILQYSSKKKKSVYFPHWNTLSDKSFNELVDMFFKLAVSSNNVFDRRIKEKEREEREGSSSSSSSSSDEESNNRASQSPPVSERKRKLKDLEKTSLVSVNPQFFYSNSAEKITIQPIPFTPNWENYIKRKPFLLLVNNKKSLEPAKKLLKTAQETCERTSISLLPGEILHYILTFLDAAGLCSISLTCKAFYKITTNDFLWKELFESKWKSSLIFNFNINNHHHHHHHHQQLDQNTQNSSIGVSPDTSNNMDIDLTPPLPTTTSTSPDISQFNYGNWKKMYIQKESIEMNWKRGTPRISILKGHESKISCLQFNQDSLLTGSKDKELRIWNLGLKKCEHVIRPQCNSTLIAFEKDNHSKLHNETFPYCLYNTEVLRLGFLNGQIQNLNLTTQSITSSQRFVFLADGFIFQKNNVYIWENEGVQLWDQTTGQKTHNISALSKIKQFKVNSKNQRFLACCDKTVKLWDIDSNSFSMQFNGNPGIVNCIDFLGDHYLLSGSCKTLSLWDIRNNSQPLQVGRSHTTKVNCISTSLNSRRICSVDQNNVLVWSLNSNLTSMELLSTIPTNHQYGAVDCLSMDDESLVLGYSKGTVAFLDFLDM
ncbi:WD40 repeat-containing protein [Tieghemostelium lacteum]|uniref:WD40 repeat-containing protein n=1 Tax=Tieghemostelium lacteum TaxID=361077 RepID=A0A151ZK10_TIELA|nr:WD40 repeat-containing protein [Tieghemostelium lacteum]|eukprot:KYQ94220.1 WD40 repeat-containing protein [Tieghemostelium lacteum]